MTKVRIYRPSRTAMQSGRGKLKKWLIEYEPQSARIPESLMGWISSKDTLNQVKLSFDTIEEAIDYAEKRGWEYTLQEVQTKKIKPRTYLDNFKYQAPVKK